MPKTRKTANLFGETIMPITPSPTLKEKSVNGYALDEVVSVIQKEIRRGHEENAVFWGLELIESGELWRLFNRLKVMAIEDCLDLLLFSAINEAEREAFKSQKRIERVKLIASAVIIQLSRHEKDRTADDMKNWWNMRREKGVRLEMPLYAVDKHTRRGFRIKTPAQLKKEFWEEGTHLENVGKDYNDKYKKELIENS